MPEITESRARNGSAALCDAAELLRALSSAQRVDILRVVLAMNEESGPVLLSELARRVDLDLKSLSKEVVRLIGAGLLRRDRDAFTAEVTWLAAVADAVVEQTALGRAIPPDSGLRRYLTNGRLSDLPKRFEDLEAMAEILAGLLPEGRTLTEREVNEILVHAGDDVARLRRLLADFGLVDRSGSAGYRRRRSAPAAAGS